MKEVSDYIKNHMADDLSVELLAGKVYLNADYLSRQFKKKTGMPLNEYMIEMRMREAAKLLKAGDLSVSQVAIQVGYLNFSYFTKQFKKKYGCTPREYAVDR